MTRTPSAQRGRRQVHPSPNPDVTIRADYKRLTFICSGCQFLEVRARGVVELLRLRRQHAAMHASEGLAVTW